MFGLSQKLIFMMAAAGVVMIIVQGIDALAPYTITGTGRGTSYRLNRWTGEVAFCYGMNCTVATQKNPRSYLTMNPHELLSLTDEGLEAAIKAAPERNSDSK
jgi:hypothetical protein